MREPQIPLTTISFKQYWRRHVIVDVKIGGLKLPKTWLSCRIPPLIKACLVWACSASGFVIVLSKKSSKLCQLLDEAAARFSYIRSDAQNCQDSPCIRQKFQTQCNGTRAYHYRHSLTKCWSLSELVLPTRVVGVQISATPFVLNLFH